MASTAVRNNRRVTLVGLLTQDFKSRVDFGINGKCDCDGYCLSEGVCRSFTITAVEFNSVDLLGIAEESHAKFHKRASREYARSEKTNLVLRGYGSKFEIYCLERVLVANRVYLPGNWEHMLTRGYYGQEVDSLTISRDVADECSRQYESICGIEGLGGRVERLLVIEYGSILPQLRGCTWSIGEVPRERLVYPQPRHRDSASRGRVYEGRDPESIMGVCKREGDQYRVVDGYHRLTQTKGDKVTIIIADE